MRAGAPVWVQVCARVCAPTPLDVGGAQGTSLPTPPPLRPPEPGHSDPQLRPLPSRAGTLRPGGLTGLALGAPSWRQEGSPARALFGDPESREPLQTRSLVPSSEPPSRPSAPHLLPAGRRLLDVRQPLVCARSRDREENGRLQGGAARRRRRPRG